MKKTWLIISGLLPLIILFSSGVERTMKSTGPPSCYAGEPPNNTNCTSCHTDATLNAGTAEITLDLGDAKDGYVPGQSYTITIRVQKQGMQRAGFQCIPISGLDVTSSPGVITLTDTKRTQLLDKNNPHGGGCEDAERKWVEHTYDGITPTEGVNTWSFKWTPPSDGGGPVTFYLAVLEANNDLAETGDHCYTRQVMIQSLPVGLKDVKAEPVRIAFNRQSNSFEVTGYDREASSVTLYSLLGTKVKAWQPGEMSRRQSSLVLPAAQLKPGVYYMLIDGRVGKVMVPDY